MAKPRATAHGITIKKKFGQHFLQSQTVINHIIEAVSLDTMTSVFEIGCGEGILTRAIIATDIARLWVFEIDQEWAEHIQKTISDKRRLTVINQDFLDTDMSMFEQHRPWVLLANLPYQITFPILYKLQKHRDMLSEGVIMVQFEVAEKILKVTGRGYGFTSLFFQHYFEWQHLEKVPPTAFHPPPKVHSSLLHFRPRKELESIPDEAVFWKFVKRCFGQPRRTLRNNLIQGKYNVSGVSDTVLKLRAQQMSKAQLIEVWKILIAR